jgi:hypothetical protein
VIASRIITNLSLFGLADGAELHTASYKSDPFTCFHPGAFSGAAGQFFKSATANMLNGLPPFRVAHWVIEQVMAVQARHENLTPAGAVVVRMPRNGIPAGFRDPMKSIVLLLLLAAAFSMGNGQGRLEAKR